LKATDLPTQLPLPFTVKPTTFPELIGLVAGTQLADVITQVDGVAEGTGEALAITDATGVEEGATDPVDEGIGVVLGETEVEGEGITDGDGVGVEIAPIVTEVLVKVPAIF
jgi:hypothetical protein